ncbi:condensation domain-containing protein [Streptomyces sp. NPDC048361]|uniref:condensation domain-containing protein n=1 Tax=Streptomyces sp. NPDC048361 TaxID=3154720 RepID=UPI003430B440
MLLRVTWFDDDVRQGRLLVTVHHLAVDAVSWHILLTDLYTAWESLAAGSTPQFGPVPLPMRDWAGELHTAAKSPALLRELPYWHRTLGASSIAVTDARLSPSRDIYATAGELSLTLPASLTTPLLTTVPAALGTGTNEVLLTGLALAVSAWRRGREPGGSTAVLLDVEGHGREQLTEGADPSGTVGWLTSLYPVRIDTGIDDWHPHDGAASVTRLGEAVRRVAAQYGDVPQRGLGFGLLRHLNLDIGPQLSAYPSPQIGYNYLGRQDGPGGGPARAAADWNVAPESDALPVGADPRMPMPHVVELNAAIDGGPAGPRLVAHWLWARLILSEEDVNGLAELWFAALRALVGHVANVTAPSRPALALPGEREPDEKELVRLGTRIGAPVVQVLPMTPLQEGLLFHARYDSRDLDVYNVQISLEVRGPLDVHALQDACDALLHRHPMLRAAFLQRATGEPVQVIPERTRMPWHTHDLTALAPREQAEQMATLLDSDRRQRFDPSKPPLMRCTLVTLAEDRLHIVLSMHHLLVDGWTTSLLLRDLLALYVHRGDDGRLPVPGHYPDYLRWLAAQDQVEARAVWTESLAGLDAPTLLCPDADAARIRALPERTVVDLTEAETSALLGMGRQQGVTLNTLVRVAWALCLHRETGLRDIVFGATVSGRVAELPGVEEMVGLFINTVPVRVRLDPAESLADLFERLHTEHAGLLPYHHLALPEIQRAAGLGTLFDSCVVFENFPTTESLPGGPDKDLRLLEATGHDAYHYPLKLMAAPGPRLHLEVSHRPDLFDVGFGGRTADLLRELLLALPSAPDSPTDRFLTPAPAAVHPGQHLLRELIAEVLGLDAVGADDDVFVLGCDSLRALRLAGRIEAALGHAVDVETIFRCRTARTLGSALTEHRHEKD